MEKFYLSSTELRDPYAPRACRMVRRLRSEIRDDLALVQIEPPLLRDIYNTEKDIDQLIIATRHEGTSLFPIGELPLAVYICSLKGQRNPATDTIASADLSILDWGEIDRAVCEK